MKLNDYKLRQEVNHSISVLANIMLAAYVGSKDVPCGVLVFGNPAKMVRKL